MYFVEAVNRLATLYFLQGRFDDSYNLCRVVLHLKPYHIGALSGIVQVCIGRGDREEARFWAQRRLPTLASGTSFPPFTRSTDGDGGAPRNPRRKKWCNQAINDAKKLLKIAEQNTSKSLGEPEDYYFQSQKRKTNRDNRTAISQNENNTIGTDLQQDDAWQ